MAAAFLSAPHEGSPLGTSCQAPFCNRIKCPLSLGLVGPAQPQPPPLLSSAMVLTGPTLSASPCCEAGAAPAGRAASAAITSANSIENFLLSPLKRTFLSTYLYL